MAVGGWITTRAAAELTGYNPVYIRRLIKQKRIEAVKAGRDWLINQDSLLAYQAKMTALGGQKYNPYRDDLEAEGRGRERDDEG